MAQENNASRLVTLFDPNDENIKNLEEMSTISLHHPSTGEVSDFILVTTKSKTTLTAAESQHQQQNQQHHVYEVQSLEIKYGSYFLGSHVLSDGTLYIATRMDPLFFVLYHLTARNSSSNSNSKSDKWQPLDQLEIPDIVKKVISSEKQYQHLCQVNNQLGDDMLLYKLSEESVLKWLTRKQEKAYQVLMDQALVRKKDEMATFVSATCHGFHLLDDSAKRPVSPTTTPSEATTIVESELSSAEQCIIHQHSMQVVCDYLTPEWRAKYMSHVGQPESVLMVSAAEEKQTPKRTWDEAADMNIVSVEKKKTKPDAQSVGLKRLQKVSTKGMKSLSSFFGAKKK